MDNLIEKYNTGVPRYTSYPSVPYWHNQLNAQDWFGSLQKDFHSKALSLYLHMPFCETLCTFCGCTKIITKSHNQETDYIDLLKKEFSIYLEYCSILKEIPLKQIHLGGGSPTFFSAKNLEDISSWLLERLSIKKEGFEGSIEVDPRRVSKEQLRILRHCGFNRISLGVQDFDPEVQRVVHRVQPFELTQSVTQMARELDYASINFDLIYGLPKQTLNTMQETLKKVIELRPDRIAFYSFAYVPWIKPSQNLFKEDELPNSRLKWQMYELAKNHFLSHGYVEIGIDHFALPKDALAIAQKEHQLHRNFMGYTDQKTDILIGLGLSSISETFNCYHQNYKDLKEYFHAINQNRLATDRGHILSQEEQTVKKQIQSLLVQFSAHLSKEQLEHISLHKNFFQDELIKIENEKLIILEKGRPFVRNVCALIDPYFQKQEQKFSQSI